MRAAAVHKTLGWQCRAYAGEERRKCGGFELKCCVEVTEVIGLTEREAALTILRC